MFEKILTKALHNFFASPKGEAIIGIIMKKAIDQSLSRTIQIEDGKTEPGKKVIKEESINVLDHLAKYMPYVEAAIRGVQVDAAAARNRSQGALNEIGDIKQIFAEEIERRNKIDNEILGKALLLSKSHVLQKMSIKDIKKIGDNTNQNKGDMSGTVGKGPALRSL